MVTRPLVLGPAFDDLADDTEETLVGSSFHQDAIVDLYVSLKRHRRLRGLSWFIGNQTKLVIPREDHGQPYQPSPDILVHPTLGPEGRTSLPVATYGPPALVIEVVSPATAVRSDLAINSPSGKPQAYAAIGVREYLAFDPFGDFIPEQVRAWRIGPDGSYDFWRPDSSRRWASDLGIAFAPQGLLLGLYDAEGAHISRFEDVEALAEERAQALAERALELAERDQRLAEQEQELAELREALRRAREGGQ